MVLRWAALGCNTWCIATCNFKCVAILTEDRIFTLNSTLLLFYYIVLWYLAARWFLKDAIVILWNKIRTWHQVNDYYLLAPVIILLLLSSWLAFSSPLFWQLDVQLKICPENNALVSSDLDLVGCCSMTTRVSYLLFVHDIFSFAAASDCVDTAA